MGKAENALENVSVKVLRTVEEVESARPIWEAMQWHPRSDIDFFLAIVSARREILRPHVVIVFVEGKPAAMAVARIEDIKVSCSIGYKTLFYLPARSLTLLHGGIFGEERYSKELVNQLLDALKHREADALAFSGIRSESVFWREVKHRLRMSLHERVGMPGGHWQADLSHSFEGFLGRFSSKQRYNLLRPRRLLERDYPDGVVFKCLSNPEEVELVCADAEHIASRTYHRGLGAGFINNEEHARRMRLEAAKGWLCAYFLYVKDEPIAFWLCTLYGETLYLNSTGYLPDFGKYEPGTILLLEVLKDCFASEKVRTLDFGAGDADYKRKFGDLRWEEETLRAYTLRPWGVFLYIAQMFPGMLERTARWCISSLGFEKRLKRIWRDRLAQKAQNES